MRVIKLSGIVTGMALWLLAGASSAQVVGLGTTKGGATAQIAAAIAKVVSANSAVQVRPQAMANTAQYIPFVNDGRIELGLANVPQTRYAVSGTGMSEGRPNANLRMLARLLAFRTGMMVSTDSGITSHAGLAGKRVPAFPERALGDYVVGAALASAGLGMNDVRGVPTSNFPTMWKMFKAGQIDTAIVAVGSKPAYDFQASLGGVRFLDFGADKATIAQQYLPGSFLAPLRGAGGTPGEYDGVSVVSFDYALFAHKDAPDDIIGEIVAALYANPDALRATSPLWKSFDPAAMSKDVGVDYHPGAISFYQKAGAWSR